MPERKDDTDLPAATEAGGESRADKPGVKVKDRRHWAREKDAAAEEGEAEPTSTLPTVVDEFRKRAEAAEAKLQEYIAAFKQAQAEQEEFRARLSRDVDRRVDLKFGNLVADLLDAVDDLDLALAHVEGVPQAAPIAQGVSLARDRFLTTLQRHGVVRMQLDGEPFDPNLAEAVRVDEVDSAERNGKVTETVRVGYALGDRVVRAARVAVGRLAGNRGGSR